MNTPSLWCARCLTSSRVLLGGVKSGHSRAGFCIQETGPGTMRGRDGSVSHTRVLDLSLQGGEAFQIRLGEIGAQKNRQDQGYREIPGGRRLPGTAADGGHFRSGEIRASAPRYRVEDAQVTERGPRYSYPTALPESCELTISLLGYD